jgi:hypothetical protein
MWMALGLATTIIDRKVVALMAHLTFIHPFVAIRVASLDILLVNALPLVKAKLKHKPQSKPKRNPYLCPSLRNPEVDAAELYFLGNDELKEAKPAREYFEVKLEYDGNGFIVDSA